MAAAFALLCILAAAAYLYFKSGPAREAQTLTIGVRSFSELSQRLQNIAVDKGALYAFDVLRLADVPPNTDLHLLGHVVGDELYKQQGIAGIEQCTDEFRNACSHTIVIGAFDEFGEAALSQIADACKRAPGGSGAYTMCFHGLGHGIFAYYGYSLPEVIRVCKKTATEAYGGREYHECFGGAIMELMGGGGHDRDQWLKRRMEYLSADDPLAPCNTALVPKGLKGMCYQYLTPNLFVSAGASLAQPKPIHFARAFEYCARLTDEYAEDRRICYEGIGKEFIGLAVARDIRVLDNPPEESLALIHDWCKLAPPGEGQTACEHSVVANLYWGGERGIGPAVAFCSLYPDGQKRDSCLSVMREETEKYAVSADTEEICKLLIDTDFSCAGSR